jgi:hypothetical protein
VRTSPPPLVLYGRSGCHLCEDARTTLDALLAARAARGLPAPSLLEVDIDRDAALHDRWFQLIPVVEIGDSRLELATSPLKIRGFLDTALGGAPQATDPTP